MSTVPLSRSPDGYVGGVCEGLSPRLGIPALWLRVIWVAAAVIFGTGIVLYLVLWWVLPRADALPAEPAVWDPQADGTYRRPFRRSTVDRKILGVCGGLARYWGLDPSIVRLVTLGIATLSLGLAGVAYLVLALVVPAGVPPLLDTRPPSHA